MTEHTKGPWSCNLDDFGYTYDDPYVTIEGENKSIAYIMVRDRARQKDITNWKANAHLIAAAPEMMEALPDPQKLEILADWLDIYDDKQGTSQNDQARDVQADLRRWARLTRQALAKAEGEGND